MLCDLILDSKKAKELDCNGCNVQCQLLRNCNGRGAPAKIYLNDQMYSRCPRAVYLEATGERFLLNTFLECRSRKLYPFPGGPSQQTVFTIQLFDFLEAIVAKHEAKLNAKPNESSKKPF